MVSDVMLCVVFTWKSVVGYIEPNVCRVGRGDGAVTGVVLRFWGLPDGIEDIRGRLQTESPESQLRYPRTHDLDM